VNDEPFEPFETFEALEPFFASTVVWGSVCDKYKVANWSPIYLNHTK